MSRRNRKSWRISMALLILLLAAFANQLSVPPSAASLSSSGGTVSTP